MSVLEGRVPSDKPTNQSRAQDPVVSLLHAEDYRRVPCTRNRAIQYLHVGVPTRAVPCLARRAGLSVRSATCVLARLLCRSVVCNARTMVRCRGLGGHKRGGPQRGRRRRPRRRLRSCGARRSRSCRERSSGSSILTMCESGGERHAQFCSLLYSIHATA